MFASLWKLSLLCWTINVLFALQLHNIHLGLSDHIKFFQGHFVVLWLLTSYLCLLWILFSYSGVTHFFKHCWIAMNTFTTQLFKMEQIYTVFWSITSFSFDSWMFSVISSSILNSFTTVQELSRTPDKTQGQWCRRGEEGMQTHPQKFWFGENPVKIPKNLGKFPEKMAKMVLNVIWFDLKKMAPNVWRITWTFFGGNPKNGLHEKIFAQKVAQTFFGQVWGNSEKNLSHPQKFSSYYTYAQGQQKVFQGSRT